MEVQRVSKCKSLILAALVVSLCSGTVCAHALDDSAVSKSIDVYDDPSIADIRKARSDAFALDTNTAKKKSFQDILNRCEERLQKDPKNLAALVWYSDALEQMAGLSSNPKTIAHLCEQAIEAADKAIALDAKCEMAYTQKALAMLRLVNLDRTLHRPSANLLGVYRAGKRKSITKAYISYEQVISLMRTALELGPERPRLAAIFSSVVYGVVINDHLASIALENKLALLEDAVRRLENVPADYKYICDVKRRVIPLVLLEARLLEKQGKFAEQEAKFRRAVTLGEEMRNEPSSCSSQDRGLALRQLSNAYASEGDYYLLFEKFANGERSYNAALEAGNAAKTLDANNAGAIRCIAYAKAKLAVLKKKEQAKSNSK